VGLDPNDSLPEGISFKDAYAAVRAWYQANVDDLAADERRGSYAEGARQFILSRPAPEDASEAEMKDVLRRVLSRDLEFAYHDSDGNYKMAAYAHAAFDAAGENPFVT